MPVDRVRQPLRAVGAYDLVEMIAEGGMGSVYRGRHQTTGQTVAVKVLAAHMLSNPVQVRRFEQEYSVARAVDHPNVVKALDFGREGTTPYLVMEFVEGESLGQRIEREGALPESEALDLIGQVARGLHQAHQLGLIHRDVKPDNVMVTPDGVARLTDLGLAKDIDADANLTRTGRGLGTPHFMAPEQFRNAKKADVRCDIYSLAATLYMMVTGELPFKSNGPLDTWMKKVKNELAPPRTVQPHLSERVDRAIWRALSPEPNQRPESCSEFLEDLTGERIQTTASEEPLDRWFIVTENGEGMIHPVEENTLALRQSILAGQLGSDDELRWSRSASGPFQRLRDHTEFRDLFAPPAGPVLVATESHVPPVPSVPAKTPRPATSLPRKQVAPITQISLPTGPARPTPTPSPAFESAELWKWVAVVAVALGSGFVGYLVMPLLARGRLF